MKKLISLLQGAFGSPVVSQHQHASAPVLSARKPARPEQSQRPQSVQESAAVSAPSTSSEPEEEDTERPTTLSGWKDLLETEPSDHPLYAEAFRTVFAASDSVEDLAWLYGVVDSGSAEARSVVEKLVAKTDDTFADLDRAYSEATDVTPFTRVLLRKALERTNDPVDYASIAREADNADDEDASAVKDAVKARSWSADDWQKLVDACNDEDVTLCNAVGDIARIKLASLQQTTPDVIQYYLDYVENWETEDDVLDAIYDRLFAIATRQELQVIAKLAGKIDDNDQLRDTVEERLKS